MTANRWLILAILFFARLTMAFQFQAVAALSPLLMETFGIGLAEIGFLIGLYFAPGIFFALPGGAVAARFGDKRIVGAGLLLMLLGGTMVAVTESWNVLVAGRFIMGTGGVILNVLMTKMLVDWFAGREISTAMAIYINSWPVGIALALMLLPLLANAGGIAFAWWTLWGLVAAAFVIFALFYHSPEGIEVTTAALERVSFPYFALTLAGLVWALYNTALAMVFSFGPALLVQQGWSLTQAGSVTSLFMVLFSIALPIGGIIADRTGRKDAIIYLSLISFAVLMPVILYAPALALTVFCVLGILFALGAGPVMTLPGDVLTPKSRSLGMGVFFTIYYVVMMVGPRFGGGLADAAGDAGMAILAGAGMSFAAAVCLLFFRRATV
ncbi:putative MFS family arabinose efflux permease [Loktanella sp. PT4BL]|jgi:MFS family permease|uniref:MFS transporter n=1 Tax=Loktanella sp. PT4BL TaxID=2135611 RepID=UPI000D766582|nr:MFS transporter [Loktanella sp. PT4BL]PXW72517.1 putative MFS family arabinose efflux permease [Loktanella sp. PT4BL]